MLLLENRFRGVYVFLTDNKMLARVWSIMWNWIERTGSKEKLIASRHISDDNDGEERTFDTNVLFISSPHLYVVLTGKNTLFLRSKPFHMRLGSNPSRSIR